MSKIKINLEDWIKYLESRVGIDVYVWGGNGELLVNQMPRLCDMEKADHTDAQALKNTDRVLTLLNKRLLQGVDIFKIRGEDCSGLAVKYLLEKGIIKSDTSADGLYNKTKAHEVSVKKVKAGDYLFDGSDSKKTHVGYAISEKYAIECQNHDVGVVKTKISERTWKYATRPDWYEGVEPIPPEPEKPVLKRELKLTDPMMKGDDVYNAQKLLNDKGYSCGTADGVFGKKTDFAVRNFQQDNNLTVDGIVGKNTAIALGFIWEG